MSHSLPANGLRRSSRISDASYHPRTTWSLPEIISGVSASSRENVQRRAPEPVENRMDVDEPDEGRPSAVACEHMRLPVAIDSSREDNALFLAARRPYREPLRRHDVGHMYVKCRWCGALHWMNERVSRSTSTNPQFGLCCNRGTVALPTLRRPPECLTTLLEQDDRCGRDFRENIWKYNRAFAFTSLQVTEDHLVNTLRRGPPVFRIQGELHHRSGPLLPAADRPPTYAQLYFYDTQAALEHRCRQNSSLDPHTLHVDETVEFAHTKNGLFSNLLDFATAILDATIRSSESFHNSCSHLFPLHSP